MESTVHKKCPDLYIQIGDVQKILCDYYHDESNMYSAFVMRNFLNYIRLWNYEYETDDMHIPYYSLDFSWIGNDGIILYGAGKVGRDYYWFIKRSNPRILMAWVDKNPKQASEMGYPVFGLDKLREIKENKILIAVDSKDLAMEIREELIKEYNISFDSIIWEKPKHCWI
jgi:hypothetical protein